MAEEQAPAPKPVTDDPDEVELLKSMNIPLTDPNAAAPEAEETPVVPAETQEPVEAEEPETPPAETTTEETTPETTPEKPAATPAEPAKPAPVTPAAQVDPLAQELATVESAIRSDDFDPFSAEGRELLLKHNRLAATAATRDFAQQQANINAVYDYAAREFGVEEKRAKSIWNEEWSKAAAKYGDTDAAHAVATEKWNDRLAAIKNGAKGPEAKAAAAAPAPAKGKPIAPTPITPAGARVTPPSKTGVPPAPRVKTDEEELVEHMRKNVPGGIKTLVR